MEVSTRSITIREKVSLESISQEKLDTFSRDKLRAAKKVGMVLIDKVIPITEMLYNRARRVFDLWYFQECIPYKLRSLRFSKVCKDHEDCILCIESGKGNVSRDLENGETVEERDVRVKEAKQGALVHIGKEYYEKHCVTDALGKEKVTYKILTEKLRRESNRGVTFAMLLAMFSTKFSGIDLSNAISMNKVKSYESSSKESIKPSMRKYRCRFSLSDVITLIAEEIWIKLLSEKIDTVENAARYGRAIVKSKFFELMNENVEKHSSIFDLEFEKSQEIDEETYLKGIGQYMKRLDESLSPNGSLFYGYVDGNYQEPALLLPIVSSKELEETEARKVNKANEYRRVGKIEYLAAWDEAHKENEYRDFEKSFNMRAYIKERNKAPRIHFT